MTIRHVAVIGAGYSGTVQAVELLRRGLAATLIERGPQPGRGVAYGAGAGDHLLNVRASGMSALADTPDHFAAWAERSGVAARHDFAPRRSYGRYLEDMLAEARERYGPRLRIVRGEAVDLVGPSAIQLASGETIGADAIVLALGNLPPEAPPAGERAFPNGIYVSDPWAANLAAGLRPNDSVLLIGTGLTAVDAALGLDDAGFGGRVLALSRRGLLPRPHGERPLAPVPPPGGLSPRCGDLLRSVRADAERIGWQAAVDRLRPVTRQLWAEAPTVERERFLRHLRPWWDVHRHRIAPRIAARLAGMARAGRLTVAAGRMLSTSPEPDGTATVLWRPRGRSTAERLQVRRIVNCTGPRSDVLRAGEPLLDALAAAGRVRSGPCRIGIDVASDCRVIARDGTVSPRLFAIGPITRGVFWEMVAVPDIRQQASRLADHLALESNGRPDQRP